MLFKILVVDDDPISVKAARMFLSSSGYDVSIALGLAEVRNLLRVNEYALILLDYRMEELRGDHFAATIHKDFPNQQIVMFSGDKTREAIKASHLAGAIDFLDKDIDPDDLLLKVRHYCLKYESNIRVIRQLNDPTECQKAIAAVGMIGRSRKLANLAKSVKKYAESGDTSVLIHGESGTGKELVAKALHDLSPRSSKPFVPINCAAIPKDLLESTFFGHKKGSFTGAVSDQKGKFHLAAGGTLFLDEIGDMPLDLQAKMLRVIQEKKIESVGARFTEAVDVRIIAASHKDLSREVESGHFRMDLLYRLNTILLTVPPLREHLEDIDLLIAHFTQEFNRKHNTHKFFQKKCLPLLKKHPWPGNIRELASVVERNLVECDDIVTEEALILNPVKSMLHGFLTMEEFDQSQKTAKKVYVQNLIEQSGSKAEAARKLGIRASLLHYYL